MISPREILRNHKQMFPASCVAWGLEVIVKMHGHSLPSEYAFQNDCRAGCGFEPGFLEQMLQLGIGTTPAKAYRDGFDKFRIDAKAAIQNGFCPIITIPSMVAINWQGGIFGTAFHTLTVTEEQNELVFLTRGFQMEQVQELSDKQMENVYNSWADSPNVMPYRDSLLIALFHHSID